MVVQPWEDARDRICNKMVKYLAPHSESAKEEIFDTLSRTFALSHEKAEGYVRKNGDALFSHILQSAELLLALKPDVLTMQVMLLHETIKVCGMHKAELAALMGSDVAELVQRFTDLKKIRLHADTQEEILKLRQMLLVLADDVRVILVKLATRLAGLLTLEGLPREKQIRLAKEMLEIYAPIAGRLGVFALKVRIEDEAFHVLHPKLYKQTEAELTQMTASHEGVLAVCKQQLSDLMRAHKLSGKIEGRVKSVYSTAKKMHQKHRTHAAELYDIFALRVIVHSKEDCYRLLGYVHEQFPPVRNRLKDYIASPKQNNYQSLHTTVTEMYPPNPMRPVEVQIRTYAMDDVAEFGVASHSSYKDRLKIADHGDLWQEKLALINKEYKRKGRLHGEEGTDLSRLISRVFVLTPKGDVFSLPHNATPLDFAYAVHSEVGHHCVGALVNGKSVPLSYTLRTGDTVQIQTRSTHKPTGTSLLYVKTPSAKARINAYLKEEQRETYIDRGKQLLDATLAEYGKPKLDPSMSDLDALLENDTSKSYGKERLLLQVGRGSVTALSVIRRIYPDVRDKLLQKIRKPASANLSTGRVWIVGGDVHVPYSLAKCCMAHSRYVKSSELVAYVSAEHLIKIHKKTCAHIVNKPSHRFLSVESRHDIASSAS